MGVNHNWTVEDDKRALDCYLQNLSKNQCDMVARELGIGEASFWMRIQNFRYLATGGESGLRNYSQQTALVWELHKRGLKTQ